MKITTQNGIYRDCQLKKKKEYMKVMFVRMVILVIFPPTTFQTFYNFIAVYWHFKKKSP